MRRLLRDIIAVVSLLAALVPVAAAKEVTYRIVISWTSGPLQGEKSRGSVSFDDSLAVPNAEYTAPNLLGSFSFRIGKQRYALSNVTAGYLSFDSTGKLRLFLFGTSCFPGGCASQAGDPNSLYFVYDSQSQLDRFFALQGPPEVGLQSYGVGTLTLIKAGSRKERDDSDD